AQLVLDLDQVANSVVGGGARSPQRVGDRHQAVVAVVAVAGLAGGVATGAVADRGRDQVAVDVVAVSGHALVDGPGHRVGHRRLGAEAVGPLAGPGRRRLADQVAGRVVRIRGLKGGVGGAGGAGIADRGEVVQGVVLPIGDVSGAVLELQDVAVAVVGIRGRV